MAGLSVGLHSATDPPRIPWSRGAILGLDHNHFERSKNADKAFALSRATKQC
jgi:hypothetical protein